MEASWVVMAIYMKEDAGFVSTELDDEAGSGDDGTGKSSANAFWSLSDREMSISCLGKTLKLCTKRKRASLKASKERHIVFYPKRGS
jgi:hypothetical protein